jgi:riboflavin kinase/FMN adenylyltransferase
MNVWNGIERYPEGAPAAVATVGNYDGVHLGHQAIIASAARDARERGVPCIVITFDPHPLTVVSPRRAPRLLLTRRQKLLALESAGAGGVLVLTFDARLAARSAVEFLDIELGDRVPIAALHVGETFRFGRGREGDLDVLRRVGERRGFGVVGVPPVLLDGQVVSSSAVRECVQGGDVVAARRLLGRPFAVTGEVVRGAGRGRSLRFPTANVEVENELQPRRGVYVTQTAGLALKFPSVTNVGVRPTFGGDRVTVETHLIDADEDLYGERLEIRFLARLRDEMRFTSAAELADQIARDRAAAVTYFQKPQLASR